MFLSILAQSPSVKVSRKKIITENFTHNKAKAHKGGMRIGKKPKKTMIAFDVLNAKELMQKL
jgi:hypothetical protein